MSETTLHRIPGTPDKFVVLEIEQDEYPGNPRVDQDNVGIMVAFHNRYDLGDKDHGIDHKQFGGWDEMEAHIRTQLNAAVILPLYLYDHSGITMRTSPFSCRWDSGQVGFIYCTKEKAIAEWGNKICTKQVKEKARSYLENEVKTYDQYLTGEVYNITVKAYQLDKELTQEELDEMDDSELADNASQIGDDHDCCCIFGSDWADYEGMQSVYSMMLDWMTPAAIEEELDKSCDCDPDRTGTILRGPRGCLSCYLKTIVANVVKQSARSAKDIDFTNNKEVALYLVQRYTEMSDDELIKIGVLTRVCKGCWGRGTKQKNQEDVECPMCCGLGLQNVVGQLELEVG